MCRSIVNKETFWENPHQNTNHILDDVFGLLI